MEADFHTLALAKHVGCTQKSSSLQAQRGEYDTFELWYRSNLWGCLVQELM